MQNHIDQGGEDDRHLELEDRVAGDRTCFRREHRGTGDKKQDETNDRNDERGSGRPVVSQDADVIDQNGADQERRAEDMKRVGGGIEPDAAAGEVSQSGEFEAVEQGFVETRKRVEHVLPLIRRFAVLAH
jgi:hypothetical protein